MSAKYKAADVADYFLLKAEDGCQELLSNLKLQKLIFSLKHIQYQGPHCISKCESEKKSLILDTILRLSQHTWSQLKSISKDTAFEILPRLRFKASLPPVLTPDVPVLVVRYDKEGRIAGFREKDIFHIVLVGKDLYPH